MQKRSWRRVGVQSAVLMAIWLTLSGLYDGFHMGLGLVSVVVILIINPPVPGPRALPLTRPRWPRILLYLPWLGLEMLKAALEVARVVLSPRMPISPCLVRFRSTQPNDFARIVLGNSITLTPGTLTVDLDGDEFLVHALTESSASELVDGRMPVRVARLFSDPLEGTISGVRIIGSEAGVGEAHRVDG